MPAIPPYLLSFDRIGTPTEGYITSTQYTDKVPFAIRRVFWTQGTPSGYTRGHHANKVTEEVLIALNGTVWVKADTGDDVQEFELQDAQTGVYIPALCWTEIRFSEDATALCLTSTDYDPADYIRTYEDFLQLVKR
ncbi:sugar 3,4-ketoisomerase [Pontibacter sp. CAU 1760]